jgi:uncharacterized protein (TIGR03085 family)
MSAGGAGQGWRGDGGVRDLPLDALERRSLCEVLEAFGPRAPTLLPGWTAADVAAHLVQRERDPIAGPCLVLPGGFQRFADRRRSALIERRSFPGLIEQLRAGPPPGFFRVPWVRSFPSLNEFFVHQEDVRRAQGLGPRQDLVPRLEEGLWSNACRAGRYLSRRLGSAGLEIAWTGTGQQMTVRPGSPVARLDGPPGELLLYLFGRQAAARVEVTGPSQAVSAVLAAQLGM